MKKKRNAVKIILITLAILLFIIVGTLTAGYFAINKMFSMVSESIMPVVTEETQTPAENSGEVAVESQASTLPDERETPVPKSGQKPEETKEPTSNSPKQTDKSQEPEIHMKLPLHNVSLSEALFKTLTEEIPFSDKLAVFNILTSGLSTSDMKRIVAMVQGGISNEEVREAYGILSRGLSDENKGKILEYYYKHVGLIQ